MLKRLENRVALVTGASSGIGRAASVAFAIAGAKVVLASRNEESSLQTLRMVEDCGGEGIFVRTDVSVAADVENMINKTLATYGQINCAFNNAGIGGPVGPLFQFTEQDFDQVININLKGVWLCMKHELSAMLAHGGGCIVNMSSVGGVLGAAGIGIYAASKHGVIGLTKVAAIEYARAGVRVNVVCPSVIDHTLIIDQLKVTHPDMYDYLRATHPIGRLGDPEEVANAVVWLCSDEASFITGASLPVDGGTMAGPVPPTS
jgi:NAD(P)-dependent dehydrogenase (short-subunit alcohol dehydrogenase family)